MSSREDTLVNTISRRTQYCFREYLSRFSVINEIDMFFSNAGIVAGTDPPKANVSGARRILIEQNYDSLNLNDWNDVKRLLRAFEVILEKAQKDSPEEFANLSSCLAKDGFNWSGSRLVSTSGTALLDSLKGLALSLDAEHLQLHIRRIEESIDNDPDQAIGSAKELVETCCKSIYQRRTGNASDQDDLPKLVRDTLSELKLVPNAIKDSDKGGETIKRVLGNLSNIVNGIAELRNWYGTGHGKDIRTKGLKPRHARLAVGAASTLVNFIFETDQEQRGGLLLENCPHCDGNGSGGVSNRQCLYCNGKGKVSAALAGKYGTHGAPFFRCPSCEGSSVVGKLGTECLNCMGAGLVEGVE